MKRCPQCEFIYEDDQTLCDMDGKELVYHAGPVAFEGSSTHPLIHLQENPWAAESLSVSGAQAQQIPAAKRPAARFEKRSQRRSEWKRFALTAAAVMFGVLVFLVYHVASRKDVSQPDIQDTRLEAPPVLSPSPETPAATDATAAVSPSSEAIAQEASDAAAANAGNSPEENVDQTKTTNSSISASHTRNLKVPSNSPDSSASPYREFAANKSKPENITAPKDASVGKHEPVVLKEPATTKPAAPVAQTQPKVVKPEEKKDSKVSSFFKKAGRILKKPF